MSEYAFAKSLEAKGYSVKIDISTYETYKTHKYELDNFNITLNTSTTEENERFKKKIYLKNILEFFIPKKIIDRFLFKIGINIYNDKVRKEKNHLFNKNFLSVPNDSYLIGDFKSEKYFKEIRKTLLKEFTLKSYKSKYVLNMEAAIKSKKNSCFVHVRRGLMATNKKANEIHGVQKVDYYLKSVKYIKSKIKDVHFFVFSDDIGWCKKYFNLTDCTFVENLERVCSNEDIYLMSLCKNSIIDHSAFCWWGAWLNKNKNPIVISPKFWFADSFRQSKSNDIYCEGWIKF